jgi:GntR family transcriptional repressor for pyruvate dehydrogenase complex
VEFHNAIGEAAHNIVLLHSLRSCYQLLKQDVFINRKLIFDLPEGHHQVMQQHLDILNAIIARDPHLARAAAEKHIDYIAEATEIARTQFEREQLASLRNRHRID